MNGIFEVPVAINEPVKSYAPGTEERKALKAELKNLRSKEMDIPMFIGGKEVRTGQTVDMHTPHDHAHKLGHFHQGGEEHVHMAIEAAMKGRERWSDLTWAQRASIFLKAADLLAGSYRAKINASTMLAQSKNAYQAEIDAACEMVDFFRFNVQFMADIYQDQPESLPGMWNRMEYRPLEGFTFAITPFNFTSIAGNLPTSMAMMGNTVVWKPAYTQIYSAWVIMEVLREAGLPDGVINLIYVDGPTAGDIIFKHPDFAGLHFTGSTGVFKNLWKEIGSNIDTYKTYPRIVGETGGKDFIMVHNSAHVDVVSTAILRGAFEFQGQKCSAASRVYIPKSMWGELKGKLVDGVNSFKMGPPEDFRNFINAVIDKKAFDKIAGYIDMAKSDKDAEIVAGGNYDSSKGYFIQPTVILAHDPKYTTMCEEIFGPVVTIYLYEDDKYEDTLRLVDSTSPYALTGALIALDRYAINIGTGILSNAAGNFYINDKPTGAVVGQQPFGGARGSGTNDKAGSRANLLRWVSMRTIKETFDPARSYGFPFMDEE